MNKNKTLLLVAAASVATTGYVVYEAATNTNTNIKAINVETRQFMKTLDDSAIVNGHIVTTKEDAVEYLKSLGINVLINDIVDFVPSTINKEIRYANVGSNITGFTSKGIEEVESTQDLDRSLGWVEKQGSNNQLLSIQIPRNAKLNNGEEVNEKNILTWLKERSLVKTTDTSSVINKISSKIKTIVEDNSKNTIENLLKQGFTSTGNVDLNKWIDDANATYTLATGENKVAKNETEEQYKQRMSAKHLSVRNFICTNHFLVGGKTYTSKEDAKQAISDQIKIINQAQIDVKSTQIELTNLLNNHKLTPSSVEYMMQSNTDSNYIRNTLGTQFIGWYIQHDKFPGLDLSAQENKDIDWNYGLPKYITDYLFENGNHYFMDELGINKDGSLSTPKTQNVDEYIKNFDHALSQLIAILDKVPSKNTSLDALKNKLKNFFKLVDENNQIHYFSTLREAYDAMKHSSGVEYRVITDANQVITSFNNIVDAQNFINTHKNAMYKFTYNSQPIEIDSKSLFTQAQKDEILSKHIYQVDNHYFSSIDEANKYAHSKLLQQAKDELNKLGIISQTQHTKIEEELAAAKSAGEMNTILNKAQSESQQHKMFNVYAKTDTTHSTPLNHSTMLSSLQGLDDLINTFIVSVHASQQTTIVAGQSQVSEKFEFDANFVDVANKLNIPQSILNAHYSTKQDFVNAIKQYIELVDVDGNIVHIDANGNLVFKEVNKINSLNDFNVVDVTSQVLPIIQANGLKISQNAVNKLSVNYDLGNKMYNPLAGAIGEIFEKNGFLVPGQNELVVGTAEDIANILKQAHEFAKIEDATNSNQIEQYFEYNGIESKDKNELIEKVLANSQESECDAQIAPQIHPQIFKKTILNSVELNISDTKRVWQRERFEKETFVPGKITYLRSAIPTRSQIATNNTPTQRSIVFVKKGTHVLVPNAIQPKVKISSEITDALIVKHHKVLGINEFIPGAPDWKVVGGAKYNDDENRWEIPAGQVTLALRTSTPSTSTLTNAIPLTSSNQGSNIFSNNEISKQNKFLSPQNVFNSDANTKQNQLISNTNKNFARGVKSKIDYKILTSYFLMLISTFTIIYAKFVKKINK